MPKASVQTLILMGLFVLFIVGYMTFGTHEPLHPIPSGAPVKTATLQPLRTGESSPPSPTAENVNHSYYVEVQRLKAELETAPADTARLIELAPLPTRCPSNGRGHCVLQKIPGA